MNKHKLRGTSGQAESHGAFLMIRAPLKTLLLQFGSIFRPNFSLQKVRNTQSIPDFPQLNLERNLLTKSSKKSF